MDLFFEELVICQLTILGQFHVTAKEITPLKHASMEKLNKVFFDKKRKKKRKIQIWLTGRTLRPHGNRSQKGIKRARPVQSMKIYYRKAINIVNIIDKN